MGEEEWEGEARIIGRREEEAGIGNSVHTVMDSFLVGFSDVLV